MRELLSEIDRLMAEGHRFGRAVVTSVWGSAPRQPGASMLATADGRMVGSVSGGCVESATVLEIAQAIERGTPKLVTFGVSDEEAWDVGLACGGTIKVFVEPAVRPEILSAAHGSGGEVVATVIEGPGLGSSSRIFEDGRVEGALSASVVRDSALRALSRQASETTTAQTSAGDATVFFEVYPREPRLVLFGGVHVAVALAPLARALGYR